MVIIIMALYLFNVPVTNMMYIVNDDAVLAQSICVLCKLSAAMVESVDEKL